MVKIIETDTKTECDNAADGMMDVLIDRAISAGYTLNGREIIGKKNGVDAPDSQRTTEWAKPEQDVNGKWFVVDIPNPTAAEVRKIEKKHKDYKLRKKDKPIVRAVENPV